MKRWLAGVLAGLLVLTATVQTQAPFATQIQIAINQLVTGVIPFTTVRVTQSRYISFGNGVDAAGYGIRDNAGVLEAKNSGGSWLPFPTSATLPTAAPFITRTLDANLSNEFALGSLGTAILINTTTTGIPTAYAGASCTNQFVQALDAVGAATCDSVVLTTDISGILPVANGGTGLSSGTSGGVLAYTATGTLASSAALAANQLVLGGGAGVVPATLGSLGTATTVLHGNAAGAPTFGAVSLTADVSGILPSANGGTDNAFFSVTGPTTTTRTFTFPNANATVLTNNSVVTAAQGGTGFTSYTVGDILYASGATALSRLADAATGNALISGGVGVAPAYGKIGLTTHVSGTLPAANGGTGIASYAVGDLIYASGATTLAARAAVALGQVLISQGVTTAPVWSSALRISTVSLGANLALSNASPTISAGFGTTPSVTAGTAASFRVNVGTGGTATNGTIGMPTAATGWNCHVDNLTGLTANVMDQRTVQLSSTTTTVVVENQTVSTGAALAWTASDILSLTCIAY